MSSNLRFSPDTSPRKRQRLTSPMKMGGEVMDSLSALRGVQNSARDILSGALNEALKSQDTKQNDSGRKENGLDNGSVAGSPSKDSNKGIRRRRRKNDPLSSDYHHTFVMKLFDKSVDLAQFPAATSLYPVCRAWMRNEPSNIDQAPRERSPTPPPPPSADSPTPDEEDREDIYALPPPTPFEGEKCPRIPVVPPAVLEGLDFDQQATNNTPPAMLLSNHMVRWWEVRKSWKKAAQQNEKRYENSMTILQEMFEDS